MGIRIGIDLGTSNSSVAYIDPLTSKPTILKNHNDMTVTPSVLAFFDDDSIMYGEDAKELQAQGFENTVSFFKRYMGNENYEIEFYGKTYSATELSGVFLKKLVEEVKEQLGEEIDEVVITVPAYFKHKERAATMEAAHYAGINVKKIINEPTAAALSYGIHGDQKEQTVLVYDLGGGTFDVTIVKISNDAVKVIGIDGNHQLGGKEWDDAIVRWVIRQYFEQYGMELARNEGIISKLLLDVEVVKKQLSVASSATLVVGSGACKGTYVLTVELFETLTQSLLELTKDCILRLFRQSGYTWTDLDGIILVGGATKMKMVRSFLNKWSTAPILNGVNPMEAVALGAAICVNGEDSDLHPIDNAINNPTEILLPVLKECILPKKEEVMYRLMGAKKVEEVIAHSLGMISINEEGNRYINSILIKKNSTIPISETKPYIYFTKKEDNELEVYLVQGEETDPLKCQVVGKYVFSDIAYVPSGKTILDITYTYNKNGMIEVEAVQRENQKVLSMRVEEVPENMEWVHSNPEEKKTKEKIPEQRVIYVAIDLSGSMKGRPLMAAKNAIYNFVHELNLSYCRVGIITFADRVKVLIPPTNNVTLLERMIQMIKLNYRELGYCNDCDPFYLLYDEFEKLAMQEDIAVKNAIVLTDGMWSHPDRAIAAAKRCHSADIDVIALGFGQARTGFLRQIASSASLAKFTELEELTIQFSKIAQEMK